MIVSSFSKTIVFLVNILMKHELHHEFFGVVVMGFPNFSDGLLFRIPLDSRQRLSPNFASNVKRI